ncbi:Sodium/hydrogen exchanger family-domain-containing protein [Alternaria rosae]|uniref:Sodium/hydrogen exchanger family-domain-containing protein n=1 Tax=Alternaria rosae TaxID=1187941 RepID=UPI001E8CB1D0|nr:Sodium/hydrogen exchanger family-domain-containing protein [Alternaria rosae]KAH6866443.1 Sodium/hydrogen exchanger family-domain-containing protein [Alternaria rosae]
MAVDASQDAASLPYHEPGIVVILVLTSFLILLNVVNAALDRVLYCGLLGQVLVGIAWGTPGAKWLSESLEEMVVQLGYLGLILLVYEGGLSTSFQSLKANLLLSSGVALTGILVPIGLSYTLQGLLDASPVQAFAAGAALCSTSLGTTFTVLGSSGLATTRLGVVLTSAAMMDDVVGLVMVQVISNLGGDNFSWVTVVRPVLVSVAFAVIAPLFCLFVAKPLTAWLNASREAHPGAHLSALLQRTQTAFVIHTLILIALVAGATYAGTSNLFAAYIAGASISWWDSDVPHPTSASAMNAADEKRQATVGPMLESSASPSTEPPKTEADQDHPAIPSQPSNMDKHEHVNMTSGAAIYEHYYHPAVSKILQPFFFASIGFSIPITRMFRGAIVWRGIVYAVLMTFAKLVCGLWLVRFSISPGKKTPSRILSKVRMPLVPHLWGKSGGAPPAQEGVTSTQAGATPSRTRPTTSPSSTENEARSSPSPPKPFSLHPPLILAFAMCARGEIGFLISGVAESQGVFGETSGEPTDIFLVVTWAIVLCTILGPLAVGLSVRRVKALQARKDKEQEGAGRDVLGVWGVE